MNEPGRGELAVLNAREDRNTGGYIDKDVLLEVANMLRRLRLLRKEQKTSGDWDTAHQLRRLRTEVDFWLYRIETAGEDAATKDAYLDAIDEEAETMPRGPGVHSWISWLNRKEG